MQPTYLPWAGYFNLIASCDVFVFLDDAQFQSATFDQRNRILWRGKQRWLTVPVRHTGTFQKYCEAQIDDSKPWRREHERLLTLAYEGSPHFSDLLPTIEAIRQSPGTILSGVTTALIEHLAAQLGFGARFVRSSELGVQGKRGGRVAAIYRALNASEYLSPENARGYLEADGSAGAMTTRYQHVEIPAYAQAGAGRFHENLSVVDIIANIGLPAAAAHIRECGRYSE